MSENLIEIRDMTKKYNNQIVLKDVNMSIRAGDSIALTGHNGSGKSTLLRIAAGLTRPTKGQVSRAPGLKIQYIPEHFPKMKFTTITYLLYVGQIEGEPKKALTEKIDELLREFFMEDMRNIPMKHLSKGTLQKVAVLQALLAKPDILLLDEPLSGQDIQSQRVFIAKVEALREQGTAIMMSCHEEFLIRHIASAVYEIQGHELLESIFTGQSNMSYHHLIFHKKETWMEMLTKREEYIREIEVDNIQMRMTVESSRANELLLTMLQDGWLLKEMYNEEN